MERAAAGDSAAAVRARGGARPQDRAGREPARAAGAVPARQPRTHGSAVMPGKRVQFDDETWLALDLLARDRMQDFQELADEAFRDLLRKYGRPTDLKSALRQSLGESATVHKLPVKTKSKKRPRTE